MIKVLFDHQIFSQQIYGGISRYFANIIQEINKIDNLEASTGLLYSENHYLKQKEILLNNQLFRPFFKKTRKIYKRNAAYNSYLLKANNFDIFHPTYFDPYFLTLLKKPLVITIHDMTYEALPEYFLNNDPLPFHKRLLADRADKIITISENTKKDIIKYLQIEESKITVIPHGIDLSPNRYETVPGLPKNYVLYIGSRSGYKNFFLLAKAFKQLSTKHKDLYLVLVGGGTLEFSDSESLLRNGIYEKTIQISATDEQLNTLYKNAACFVFPSLYEGFGIPILEAFKNSCPIVLSDCSCFSEIAGNAALYFESTSIQSLIDQVDLIISDHTIRDKLTSEGSERLQRYSLQKCLDQTINVYKNLLSSHR